MKSWKTTIGGSLETLGTGLRDLTTLASLSQVASGDEFKKINIYTIIVGMVINLIGKFFSNLFAADNSAVSEAVDQHSKEIAELKRDTTLLAKPEPPAKVGP